MKIANPFGDPFADPEAVAYANFFLLRGLIKALVIEGPMEPETLVRMMEGTIQSADASKKPQAAEVLRGLRFDLGAYAKITPSTD